MGVPADAAFTLQVLWAGELPLTGDPLRARLQTCPEAPLDGTRVHLSENPVVARWPVLGSVFLELAWLAMSGREESTFLLDGAFCMVRTLPGATSVVLQHLVKVPRTVASPDRL